MGTEHGPRLATPEDAEEIARLLIDFNTEFDTPVSPLEELAGRVRRLLAGPSTFVVLAGDPSAGVAVAVVTLRPNVWYEGPVALLDELYVVPALRGSGIGTRVVELMVATCRERAVEVIEVNVDESDVDALRFYRRHGFVDVDPDTGEKAFYVYRELD